MQWFNGLGTSGKLLAVGGAAGVVACLLPLYSVSVQIMGMNRSESVLVVRDWRGTICLLGYAACVAAAWLLYKPGRAADRNVVWAAVGAGGLVAVMAVWLFFAVMSADSGSAGFEGMGSFRAGASIGAYLNLLTAAAVAAGAVMKAREERLF
jgi:hypothetical protein